MSKQVTVDRRQPVAADAVDCAVNRIRFLTAKQPDPVRVRPAILASWQRSRDAGIAADRVQVPFLRDPEVDTPLTRSAEPVLRRLVDRLADQAVSIILTDPSGTVLTRRTPDHGFERQLDRVLLAPGFSYAERFAGTNGIGTTLETGIATTVLGHEHYAENLERLACAAAPIHDPTTGRLAGVLDLTCWRRDTDSLLLTLAETTAEQIQHAMGDAATEAELALLQTYRRTCLRTSLAVLAVSADAVTVNDRGRDELTADEQRCVVVHALDRGATLAADARRSLDVLLPTGRTARLRCHQVGVADRAVGLVVQVRITSPSPAVTTTGRDVGTDADRQESAMADPAGARTAPQLTVPRATVPPTTGSPTPVPPTPGSRTIAPPGTAHPDPAPPLTAPRATAPQATTADVSRPDTAPPITARLVATPPITARQDPADPVTARPDAAHPDAASQSFPLSRATAAGRPGAGPTALEQDGLVGVSAAWQRSTALALAAARAGRGLVLRGEPGTGKRALAEVLVRGGTGCTARLDARDSGPRRWLQDARAETAAADRIVLVHADELLDTQVDELADELTAARERGAWVCLTATRAPAAALVETTECTVELPPLRLRTQDVPPLVRHLLAVLGHRENLECSSDALAALARATWPGNVEQLRATLAEVVASRHHGTITAADLPADLGAATRRVLSRLEALEREAIVDALAEAGGDKLVAARRLGISRATIYRRIRDFGILAP